MRIGILGGTFDPPHTGHLSIARAALKDLKLEEVLLLPANRNPLKARPNFTHAKHRAAMVEALIRNEPNLAYSDLEITRGGQSFTVDTLSELQMVKPAEYWFLMGADALRSFPEWKHPDRIVKLARIGVAIRPPTMESDVVAKIPPEYRDKVDVINMQPVDISSSELRDRISKHLPVSPWIPNDVLKYITTNRLYQE